MTRLEPARDLPGDWQEGTWLGRIDLGDGSTPALVASGVAHDLSRVAPTVAELVAARAFDPAGGAVLGQHETLDATWLAPVDLQCVKAAGVTFAVSTSNA